jgi:hypothetical protein
VEATAGHTVKPEMAEPMVRLDRAIRGREVLVHRRGEADPLRATLREGVRATSIEDLLAALARPDRRSNAAQSPDDENAGPEVRLILARSLSCFD